MSDALISSESDEHVPTVYDYLAYKRDTIKDDPKEKKLVSDINSAMLKMKAGDSQLLESVLGYFLAKCDRAVNFRVDDVVGDKIAKLAIKEARQIIGYLKPIDPQKATRLETKWQDTEQRTKPYYER